MFDQSYGLRFDIYERINLTEDLPGIEELEEAELIPHIQVISQQDQATLRGHLLLAGLYKGDTEAGETEPLEHWIPVEITVPLNRVSSLDDIAVEIENFDVDLLSKRSLNITGVLSLKGIQAAAPGSRDQVWANEEFTVVHAPETPNFYSNGEQQFAANPYEQLQGGGAGEDTNSASPPYFNETQSRANVSGTDARTQQYLASWAEYENQIQDAEEPAGAEGFSSDQEARDTVEYALHNETETIPQAAEPEPSIPSVWQFERVTPQPETVQEEPAADFPGIVERKGEEVEAVPVLESSETEEAQPVFAEGAEASEDIAEEISAKPEEVTTKPELKVAFSTKNSTTSTSGVGFSSLLQSSRTVQDQDQAARDEEEEAEELVESAASEDVEWKSLFLGNRHEETPFRKVRMCIVQREETLDLIAERYQLTPRELLLYNRMSEQNVEEGQVLYIPQ
ncbi:LysM peptidoglycan-binding domain-containing protein [Paenibacillus glucanolyticus]|uniref:LysM peptidoglycan-binding domain-containing protein n=1 Tax=Paenibacillus TaxID=44249 RepID=UPI0003E1BF8B|nr:MULTISPECIES: LysM peptidoglycan-binding domain-containing protein [Paenibacillus]ANA81410.1 peptidoglycan-binding protein [Paenibacillus glucanolyticus]AVV59860.1 LysM peptidoglycan-binding domain-containing protein [Paenibacillus glucanolyticus]ETT35649.1 peptidoglycan-binding lysin domain-containing protein [Paenibacillus sp. FSL R5-808]